MNLKEQVKYLEDNYYNKFKATKNQISLELVNQKYALPGGNLFINEVNRRTVNKLKGLIKI